MIRLWPVWQFRVVVYCGLVGMTAVFTKAIQWVATT